MAVSTNIASTEVVFPVGLSQPPAVSGQQMLVYPNPFQSEINFVIEGMKGKDVTVKLYDIYGRMLDILYSGNVTSDDLKVSSNLNTLSSGIYFVRMESHEGTQNLRIVKY